MIGLVISLLVLFSTLKGQVQIKEYNNVTIGAQQFENYLPKLKNKRVAIITNITGMIGKTSIVDTLLKLGVNVKKIFGPEHGFRSDAEAGDKVSSGIDKKTGLPIVSLYGSNKKPTKEQLADVDVVVYDIQDIGVRFYTYISTMCYGMEACAENGKEFIVLDRPNPNGFYIDGPVLKPEFKSFLGLHAVPIVYGMTCGEYAQMANGEGWLKNKIKCKLTVIPLKNYDRTVAYYLPVKPSPNIPNVNAVLLYPSLGLFEGTIMSLGRGTQIPFQVIGHPNFSDTGFSFIPLPTDLSKEPKYVNQKCYGLNLNESSYLKQHPQQINLEWLQLLFSKLKRDDFFDKNFNYHVGNSQLQQQIKTGVSITNIKKSWQPDLEKFKKIRKKYLLYKDFN
ncbi:MAG: DUF1343 domain-containing protein [Bacteroidota bacterium]|nr:DUF1343 domain-containing protein [Bacteroidota bacterium]